MLDLRFDLTQGALLFDCDGTITDETFLPHIVGQTIKEIVESQGGKFDQEVFDQVFKINKGGGFDKYYNGYLTEAGLDQIKEHISEAEFSDQAIDRYLATTEAIANGEDVGVTFKINQDAITLIRWANENNIPVAIVTNANPRILKANLQAASIGIAGETKREVFTNLTVHRGMYGGDSAPFRKPHPFPFEEACRLLGVDPKHSIGFEDSANGHESLFRAKIGLRVHVCEEQPTEPVHFVKGDLKFGPDAIAPYGQLTPEFIQDIIDRRNETGNVISLSGFPVAANKADQNPGQQNTPPPAALEIK